ncbi:class GN sortase [Paralimibaculum aggregatum]|uniref:Class GN sortase n=1 Tax=Paralimibaculum aggregatum TaxID=3036245 RepID=A0ABQ6LGF2_9RHOB|nr:class GN sortase [Limibaculum sp. NKW23]GMG81114.1 class GN sortase [Limibaculum sp. NKW23]
MSRGPLRRAGQLAGAGLMAAGLVLAAEAAYLPAKAKVGQWLLEAAWAETLETGRPARPWSWADVAPAARLSAPALGAAAVVLASASGEAMAWGPGHVPGTAPLGTPGLAAVAGHRDTHLAFLAKLRPGDLLALETPGGGVQRYRVTRALVVDSREWRFPVALEGPRRLALATCWPFDGDEDGPMRFVLFAEEIAAPETPAA